MLVEVINNANRLYFVYLKIDIMVVLHHKCFRVAYYEYEIVTKNIWKFLNCSF